MNPAQIRLTRRSSAYWRVTIDNPPINVMGPVMVKQFQEVINALEADEQVRVVVFDSGLQNRSWRACFESLRRCFTNSET
jgi:enoyl-CoA hydratase/carnithine racemase